MNGIVPGESESMSYQIAAAENRRSCPWYSRVVPSRRERVNLSNKHKL